MPADLQALFQQRFAPVRDEASLRSLNMFLRFSGDRRRINWDVPARARHNEIEVRVPAEPADDLRQLVGKPLPDLSVEATPGITISLRPSHASNQWRRGNPGPALLYVTPAWPRPMVARQEEFADLKALARMDPAHLQLFGTEATARELREWWKERQPVAPPLALLPESAAQLGARHQPPAIVLDSNGRVTWVKQGYAPGDEVEWGRQLAQVGARSPQRAYARDRATYTAFSRSARRRVRTRRSRLRCQART